MGLSLCYCFTEVWDKVSTPSACQSLPLGCHMDRSLVMWTACRGTSGFGSTLEWQETI